MGGRLVSPPFTPPEGLRQDGTPGRSPKECAAVVLELKKRPRPRSPSLTTPVAVMNTLAGLISADRCRRQGEGGQRSCFQGSSHSSWYNLKCILRSQSV